MSALGARGRLASWLGRGEKPLDPRAKAYDPAATADDILACFRLLLGRPPNREEWIGHVARAGEPLPGVVGSYVNSLEFSRRNLLAQDHMAEVELKQLPDFRIYAAGGDAAVGGQVLIDNYELDVRQVFLRNLQPGMHVLDIGANIGYFTMLSAALVGPSGSVFAIEPNPRNARMLEASRRANGFANVTILQTAAGADTGLLVLHRSHSNGTTSALPDALNALLGAETVPCVRADAVLPSDRAIALIKVDVEGAEHLALRGCEAIIARDSPLIVSEFSPDLMEGISGIDGRGYLAWLTSLGYGVWVIEPNGALMAATIEQVMATYLARGTDHIDIVASQRQPS